MEKITLLLLTINYVYANGPFEKKNVTVHADELLHKLKSGTHVNTHDAFSKLKQDRKTAKKLVEKVVQNQTKDGNDYDVVLITKGSKPSTIALKINSNNNGNNSMSDAAQSSIPSDCRQSISNYPKKSTHKGYKIYSGINSNCSVTPSKRMKNYTNTADKRRFHAHDLLKKIQENKEVNVTDAINKLKEDHKGVTKLIEKVKKKLMKKNATWLPGRFFLQNLKNYQKTAHFPLEVNDVRENVNNKSTFERKNNPNYTTSYENKTLPLTPKELEKKINFNSTDLPLNALSTGNVTYYQTLPHNNSDSMTWANHKPYYNHQNQSKSSKPQSNYTVQYMSYPVVHSDNQTYYYYYYANQNLQSLPQTNNTTQYKNSQNVFTNYKTPYYPNQNLPSVPQTNNTLQYTNYPITIKHPKHSRYNPPQNSSFTPQTNNAVQYISSATNLISNSLQKNVAQTNLPSSKVAIQNPLRTNVGSIHRRKHHHKKQNISLYAARNHQFTHMNNKTSNKFNLTVTSKNLSNTGLVTGNSSNRTAIQLNNTTNNVWTNLSSGLASLLMTPVHPFILPQNPIRISGKLKIHRHLLKQNFPSLNTSSNKELPNYLLPDPFKVSPMNTRSRNHSRLKTKDRSKSFSNINVKYSHNQLQNNARKVRKPVSTVLPFAVLLSTKNISQLSNKSNGDGNFTRLKSPTQNRTHKMHKEKSSLQAKKYTNASTTDRGLFKDRGVVKYVKTPPVIAKIQADFKNTLEENLMSTFNGFQDSKNLNKTSGEKVKHYKYLSKRFPKFFHKKVKTTKKIIKKLPL